MQANCHCLRDRVNHDLPFLHPRFGNGPEIAHIHFILPLDGCALHASTLVKRFGQGKTPSIEHILLHSSPPRVKPVSRLCFQNTHTRQVSLDSHSFFHFSPCTFSQPASSIFCSSFLFILTSVIHCNHARFLNSPSSGAQTQGARKCHARKQRVAGDRC